MQDENDKDDPQAGAIEAPSGPHAASDDGAGLPLDPAAEAAAAVDADVLAATRQAAGETAPEEPPPMPPEQVRAVLEALIFASPQPLTAREIGQVLAGVPKEVWRAAVEELQAEYGRDGRGLQLVEVAGGFQITTRPEHHEYVRELLDPRAPARLSIQALETLAVIAYKQPVTLPEIIDLRGVKSAGVIKTLLEKRLIRITGRKEVVGRPMLYGTTREFLLRFGLKDLGELPKIEEFAEVLGEEVDVEGLKKAVEAPAPTETPLSEDETGADAAQGELPIGEPLEPSEQGVTDGDDTGPGGREE